MDGQFETLQGDLAELNIGLETVGHDDHVPEIERHIRTLKEQTRAIFNSLEMIYVCNFWLNAFPRVLARCLTS